MRSGISTVPYMTAGICLW